MKKQKPISARLIAARAVQTVMQEGAQLEAALAGQRGYSDLEPRDRAFARLLVATTFRRLGQIDRVLQPYLKKPPTPHIMALLRIGATQILVLKTPAHAAVGEMVQIVKSSHKYKNYAGLVNAVLRRVVDKGPAAVGSIPPKANIPGWIYNSWEKAYGASAARRMAVQLMADPPLDLSVKSNPQSWAEKLGGDVLLETVVRLPKAGQVTKIEGYDDGEWWVQDIASSIPVSLLAEDLSGQAILDMCAAPGGKTMQLATRGADVTTLDKSEARMEKVIENLKRTGLKAETHIADAREWQSDQKFDAVLLDAPCSATGTFRRHPDVLYNKKSKDVVSLVRLQKALLKKAVTHLKPGGDLIYCTCSLQTEEGEQQINRFLRENPDFELVCPTRLNLDPFITNEGFIRVLPDVFKDKGGADGFFVAWLRYKL